MAISEEEEELFRQQAFQKVLEAFRGKIFPLTKQVRRITRRIVLSLNLGHLEGSLPQERLPVDWGAVADFSAEIPRSLVCPEKEWIVNNMHLNAFVSPGVIRVPTGSCMSRALRRVWLLSTDTAAIGMFALLGIDAGESSIAMKHLHLLPSPQKNVKQVEEWSKKPSRTSGLKSGVFHQTSIHTPTAEWIAECSQLDEMRSRRILMSRTVRHCGYASIKFCRNEVTVCAQFTENVPINCTCPYICHSADVFLFPSCISTKEDVDSAGINSLQRISRDVNQVKMDGVRIENSLRDSSHSSTNDQTPRGLNRKPDSRAFRKIEARPL
ncbi:hypothetical protein C8F04DRAFT_1235396 [Mycena alexandri]|uniref:Uncharacterized protein n=1 Tax=Mycena alexandri TaxID=1745969 RepID=A0AAD6SR02_9AGAR|nr:hypothetical protein C8F04DRAFT_1235396 [Mycena alexandri]